MDGWETLGGLRAYACVDACLCSASGPQLVPSVDIHAVRNRGGIASSRQEHGVQVLWGRRQFRYRKTNSRRRRRRRSRRRRSRAPLLWLWLSSLPNARRSHRRRRRLCPLRQARHQEVLALQGRSLLVITSLYFNFSNFDFSRAEIFFIDCKDFNLALGMRFYIYCVIMAISVG